MKSFYKNKKTLKETETKDLSWLLRYASNHKIEKIIVRKHNRTNGVDAFLEVHFEDVVFESEFADHAVLIDWLRGRRSWHGVEVSHYLYNQFSNKTTLGA